MSEKNKSEISKDQEKKIASIIERCFTKFAILNFVSMRVIIPIFGASAVALISFTWEDGGWKIFADIDFLQGKEKQVVEENVGKIKWKNVDDKKLEEIEKGDDRAVETIVQILNLEENPDTSPSYPKNKANQEENKNEKKVIFGDKTKPIVLGEEGGEREVITLIEKEKLPKKITLPLSRRELRIIKSWIGENMYFVSKKIERGRLKNQKVCFLEAKNYVDNETRVKMDLFFKEYFKLNYLYESYSIFSKTKKSFQKNCKGVMYLTDPNIIPDMSNRKPRNHNFYPIVGINYIMSNGWATWL